MRASSVAAILLSGCALASAQDVAVDPLLAAHETDRLELARVVDRIGDDAVLSRLAPETPIAVRALAVAATPALHAPERALAPLSELAAGRDPDLAPRAAQALSEIARALDARGLDARECDRAELAPARAGLARVAADETARGDVRRAAIAADAALADLAIPGPG